MHITENFTIDKLKLTDANQLYQFMIDNYQRLLLFFPLTLSSNSSIEKTKEYISIKEKEIQEKSNFTLAIREKDSQNIAGLIIIKKIDWEKRIAELAYCIGSEYEGRGMVSFAVKGISKYSFDELELKTLHIISHKTNLGSVKVAQKCGFVWSETLKNEFTPTNGLPLDMELYELTR
ncbi:N-acetyltransferase [Flavobacterium sp. RSP49]|uniref:GNAT family N-acetyltransferase n=1 Tax=unclassified Flavobacterium TaxID=196869 RepID=UPI000F832A2C|nr:MULTISPECIES: GNAT family N-acetyltransferase [unclassified Flavobacterium]RTY70420.1 N-acetyltransferase [Flavobacterium sp. LB2P53]RTY88335.1 N-acetyltransferase [Flavobacterium sp. RSP15]RTY92585.1 N-acetyltransferase [Flavobacterium sp. RSP46]RTZ02212.1 N-acetyltransferase [Flavobacterium sp. RSP49]